MASNRPLRNGRLKLWGIVSDGEYWTKAAEFFEYLDSPLMNVANILK